MEIPRRILFLALFACCSLATQAQGMVVNEVSNGPSGNKEYMEFVVVGTPCTTVDLRGWIIDDNNGDFACGPISGVGIAAGHVRLANVAAWSAIPVGSILLFHNDADLNALVPANDPTDADMDSVYVIPYSSTLLERTSGGTACPLDGADQLPIGCNAACPAAGSAAYLPSVYVAGGNVSQISMANTGDACQVRTPLGTYFHGISYGSNAGVTGGPEGLKVSALSGSGAVYYLGAAPHNTLANWSTGVDDGIAGGDETPGAPNNAINAAYIDLLLGDCILPVQYAQPLQASWEGDGVLLQWETSGEAGSRSFAILRQADGQREWEEIGQVDATGSASAYTFLDARPAKGSTFYRLLQKDSDGALHFSNVAQVTSHRQMGGISHTVSPNPSQGRFSIEYVAEEDLQLVVMDAMGRQVYTALLTASQSRTRQAVDLGMVPAGMYHYALQGVHVAAGGVLVVQ